MGILDMFMPGASQYLTPEQQDAAGNRGLLNASLGLIDASSNHYGLPVSPFQIGAAGVRGYGQGVENYVGQIPQASTATLADAQNRSALALQPFYDQQMKSMMSGANGMAQNSVSFDGSAPQSVPSTYVSPYFRQALMAAYASHDPKQVSGVLTEMGKADPQAAGAVKRSQEMSTFQKTPQGTYQMPEQSPNPFASFYGSPVTPAPLPPMNAPSPAAVGNAAMQQGAPAIPPPDPGISLSGPGQIPAPPPSTTIPPQRDFAALPAANASAVTDAKPLLAADGKPLLRGLNTVPKPDPAGTPRYNTENTETGVNQTKQFQSVDVTDDGKIGDAAVMANQQASRINDMVDAMKSGQAGTLLAQDPDLAQKLIAAGIVTDKGAINNVAQYQRMMADQIVEVLNQIKNANAGTSQGRILASELQGMQARMADPGQQPEAIRDILAMAKGVSDYNADMSQGWSAIGGLGNRAANGFTLRPGTYQQQFALAHPIDSYVDKVKKDIGPLKGMPPENPYKGQFPDAKQAPDGQWYVKVNGKYNRIN